MATNTSIPKPASGSVFSAESGSPPWGLVTPCHRCLAMTGQGACCRYVELTLARRLSNDEQRWLRLHDGLDYEISGGQPIVRIQIPCTALAEDGRCRLFGQPERPVMCQIWPAFAETSVPTGCAYTAGIRLNHIPSPGTRRGP